MNRPSATIVIAAATLLVAVAGASLAVAALAGETPDPADNPITPEEALATDAAHYASDFGVTQPEAERRASLQDQVMAIDQRLKAVNPERYAGSWIRHEAGTG